MSPRAGGNNWERMANKVASTPTMAIPRRMTRCDLERASAVVSSSENRAQATFKMGVVFDVSVSITGSFIIDPGVSGDFAIIYL
jgi:hypothetical protein